MKHQITTYPNKELFQKTRDIPKDQITGDTYRQIGAAMLEILRKSGGVGLSANQVGLPLNMCVIQLGIEPKIMLNPRIIKQSDKMVESPEGCLSLPGASTIVNRHATITVEYEDVSGETQQYSIGGLEAYCIQHEIDHLKGILIINRISEIRKSKFMKQMQKFIRKSK